MNYPYVLASSYRITANNRTIIYPVQRISRYVYKAARNANVARTDMAELDTRGRKATEAVRSGRAN